MESSTKVGRIYAAAIYQLALKAGKVGEIHDELLELDKLYRTNHDFRNFFGSPKLSRDQKWASIKQLFEGKISDMLLKTLGVMISKGRETALDNVVAAFGRFRDEAEDRAHAYVTSAVPLSAEQKSRLLAALSWASKSVILHDYVDPALIGGMIVKVRDFVVDNTLRSRLRDLQQDLMPTGFRVT